MTIDTAHQERLRVYLAAVNLESRKALLVNLERGALLGGEMPELGFILDELRSSIRSAGVKVERIGNPSRLFFEPLEPYLVSGPLVRLQRGTIARPSLSPIWIWICRDLIPAEAKAYVEAAKRSLLAGARDASRVLAHEFRTRRSARLSACSQRRAQATACATA